MRFASTSRPALTPLGWRLINLSEQKLYDLDAPTGARESGSALLRGVLVREAVKSAWSSIDDGSADEMTNWKSETAMGLDVIGEDDEDDEQEDEQEERWFEDLLSSLGEEEQRTTSADWVESEVVGVDDELYDVEEMEAYTIPLPPSPPVQPKLPSVESTVQRFASPIERITIDSLVTVDAVAAVDDEDDDADDDVSGCSDCSMCRSIAAHLDGEFPSAPAPPSTPITRPISTCDPASGAFVFDGQVIPDVFECDDDDDMLLPPPLHRSWSTDSTDSLDDEVCRTPTLSCEELEEEAESYWVPPSKGGAEVEDPLDTALRFVF